MDIQDIVARVTKEVMARMGESAPKGESNAGIAHTDACIAHTDVCIAHTIEHSLLNPDMTKDKIIKGCKDAKAYRMANICVSPYYVSLAAEYLRGSGVKVCAPVAFPHGAASTAAKIVEAREAIKNGAEELDVSMNILAIKNGELEEALRDLCEVVNVAKGKALVKAIYEQGLYTDEEKAAALNIAKQSGADFIKISNALTGKKALAEDVRFVRGIVGSSIGIKIDGGIATVEKVRELMAAGAQRFGCSKSVEIVQGR